MKTIKHYSTHNIKEIEGYGRTNYQMIIPPSHLRKFIFYRIFEVIQLDSKTEPEFSFVQENDKGVLRWLRPAREQFSIYWSNGSKIYEPADVIYMVETKVAVNVSTEEV